MNMEEESLKVEEETVPVTEENKSDIDGSNQQEKQQSEEVVKVVFTERDAAGVDELKIDAKPEANVSDEVSGVAEVSSDLIEIESKTETKTVAALEDKHVEMQNIEECDTGGDEVPDVGEATAVCESIETLEIPTVQAPEEKSAMETESKTEVMENVCEEIANEEVETKQNPEVVAIDDDDDDDDDVMDDEDDDEDDDEEDEDEEDEGVNNEAMNEDEDREPDSYKVKDKTGPAAIHLPHPLDDFDDDYDEMDDEDDGIDDLKDDSNAAVVIGSSDEEDQVPQKPEKAPQKYEDVDEELDYDDDDVDDEEDDDYDDDDLMNAVVTSATKTTPSSASSSPVKKEQAPDSQRTAREREAEQISLLKRGINYGRIAKKKSLNWLYNKKKREAYKLILPRNRQISTTTAMRSDQSGGLLHLKITPPSVTSIAQKHIIKQTPSTPVISKTESRVPISVTPQKSTNDEYIIDLDSSPEKSNQEQSTPRRQSDDQQNSEANVKKPPDNKEEDHQHSTMQQTDKVRDTIQKSTEEVQEDKSVSRLNSEQNKENLQSNEALKKERDEVSSKQDIQPKDTITSAEIMDTTEEISESTLKAEGLNTSTATSLKADIKEEKIDKLSTPPPTDEVSIVSKVVIEDVPENETTRPTSPPQITGTATTKRRRSSSGTQERNKITKSNSVAATCAENDDDEEYIHPTKKLREELQSNYPAHDRILNEYIEKTSNDSIDSIQRHIEQMLSEIQTLNDMIKAKEIEWNNMLHLKKVKEEICFRLTRRKQCMEIMATKVGEAINPTALDEDYLNNESTLALGKTPPSQKNPQLSSTPIAGAISSISSNICNFTAVSSSSSVAPTTAQLIIQNRANMKSADLVKEKANTQRLHRNILPKPTTSPTGANANQQGSTTNGPSSSNNQPILNSYLTSADSVHQLFDMMNGHHSNHGSLQNGGSSGNNNSQAAMVGRQGPFKDVRSIIADFRQQHPEVVPRRGRRVKNSNNSNLSDSNTILGNALKSDTNSRPSSNDSSSHSLSTPNPPTTNNSTVNSFKDVLAPFAKSQAAASLRSAGGQQQNPPYPEVTLHPVSAPIAASGGDQPTGSLLHGYLTKFPRPNDTSNTKTVGNQTSATYISNFSPTLARLLTAPERISAGAGASSHHNSNSGGGDNVNNVNAHHSISGFGVNLSKVVGHNSEITITPVMNSMHQQSILQQQLQQQQLKEVLTRAASGNSVKDEHFLKLSSFASAPAGNDDDAEDSVDRLVIDEGVDAMVGADEHQRIAPHAIGQEFNENEVPVCQGCKKHEAQFVCAGCGNQWYCSRECQVTAWDDHSEVCTATKQIRNNFNVLKSRDLVRGDQFYIVRRRKRNKFYPHFL